MCEIDIPEKPKKRQFHWKNLLEFDIKKDWKVILFVIFVVYMAWAYKTEMAHCRDIMSKPYTYCDAYCDTRHLAEEGQPWGADDFWNVTQEITIDGG